MYFDALTSAAIADECRALVGGRVQEVVQVDGWTVGLEVYAQQSRQHLVASAHPQHSRLQLTETRLRRGVDVPTALLLLLRKYVRDGRIVSVQNPEFERIVRLEFHPPGDVEPEEETVTLVVEAMGRHANVILLDAEGTVMDAIKRVGPRMSRVRPILPGKPYAPPPPQAKMDPPDVTELRLRRMLEAAEEGGPIWRALVDQVRGVSPLLAREVVYRAFESSEAKIGDEGGHVSPLLDAFHGLWSHAWEHEWEPSVGVQEGVVTAFAPYLLTQYVEHERVKTISAALDRYYSAQAESDAYAPARARVQAALDEARKRVSSRHRALERQLISQQELDRLRLNGEMILAYAHTLQRGDTRLEAQVDFENPPLAIDLDPNLTPVENAQAYFERYEKAKSATAEIPQLLAQADLELDYLDQLATDLELASNRPEIDEVYTALEEAGYAPPRRGPKAPRGQPLRIVPQDGLVIWVGRSARQNQEVTFRRADPDDLWLHVVGAPGAHVIVKSGGRPVPEGTLQQAAALAAYYSALRQENNVLVAYTQRRYVRHIRGARPGMVTYRREQTMRVSPARNVQQGQRG
jgi:predicted ribosome quality control (RQC) complex YloA/Tae2 family protein